MSVSSAQDKQRWVVYCDPLTVASIKALAAGRRQSMGHTLDQAVEYFCRKVDITREDRFKWQLPDDF